SRVRGDHRRGRRLVSRADPRRRPRRDRCARALVQCDGRAAPPHRRDEGRVLCDAVARAALAAHVCARGCTPLARRSAGPAQRQAGAPRDGYRTLHGSAVAAGQPDARALAAARGGAAADARARRPGARGRARRGRAAAPGRGGRRRAHAGARGGGVRWTRRRGPARAGGRESRRQRHSVHAARRPRDGAADRRGSGDRDPGRGHGRRDPGGGAATHLRLVAPGPQRSRRHRSGARRRARRRARAWRPRDRGVAGGQGEPVHGSPATLLVKRPTRALAIVLLLAATAAGCASWTWWPFRPAAMLLIRADRAADELRFRQARALYDEFLARYPDDVEARRALESRDTVAAIVTTREELARLRGELRAREIEAGKLRDEVSRLRKELASRQAEGDKLRADLERMKELDLKLERRRC